MRSKYKTICPYCKRPTTIEMLPNSEQTMRCSYPCTELFAVRVFKGATSAAKIDWNGETELKLAEARAEIEILKAPTSAENLDERMKAAGMFTVAEMLAGTPLDKFFAHVGVVDMKRFEEWLLMRRGEFLKMQASMELDELKKNDLYEWVVVHAAVLAEVLANFRQARPDIERKDKLIKQMASALNHCKSTFEDYVKIHKAKMPVVTIGPIPPKWGDMQRKIARNQEAFDLCNAALAAERGE